MPRQLKPKKVYVVGDHDKFAHGTMTLDFGDNKIRLRVTARKGEPLIISLESGTVHRLSIKPCSDKAIVVEVVE